VEWDRPRRSPLDAPTTAPSAWVTRTPWSFDSTPVTFTPAMVRTPASAATVLSGIDELLPASVEIVHVARRPADLLQHGDGVGSLEVGQIGADVNEGLEPARVEGLRQVATQSAALRPSARRCAPGPMKRAIASHAIGESGRRREGGCAPCRLA